MLLSCIFWRGKRRLVCYVHCHMIFFICDKIDADHFEYEITTLLKENDRLKFSQDVALNPVIEKEKPQWKI